LTAIPEKASATLRRLAARPEIRPLVAGLGLSTDATLALAFSLGADGRSVTIGPPAGSEEASLAMVLRHAAETALWLGLAGPDPDRERRIAVALLAGHCLAVALAHQSAAERLACHTTFDPALAVLLAEGPPPVPALALAELTDRLLVAQGCIVAPVTEAELAGVMARDWFCQSWELALPVEVLLTADGDSRLRLDPETGLNRYGCSPRPRPQALTFASTTATSISDEAFAHVEALRRRLASAAMAGGLAAACAEAKTVIRADMLAVMGAPAGTEAVLAPSGTDGELHALQLALAADHRPLTTIVIAPRETGSTVVPAAMGRHHNATTAHGEAVAVGDPVDGPSADRVELVALSMRDDDGALLPPEQVDAAATALVEGAIGAGRRVLLHLLDTSKTGLIAPGLDCVCALARRFAGSLDVVVDAAQLRLGSEMVAAYLDQGFMLIVTGSKFFTGPPFAGALLVPAALARRVEGGAGLPAGYDAYTDRDCWPDSWDGFCRVLGQRPNLGLIMRWWAALWEMAAFARVPAPEARHILSTFLAAVAEAIAASPWLRPLPGRQPDRRPLSDGRGWDGLATIHTFALLRPGTATPLDFGTTRRIYGWLNRDVAAFLPEGASDGERRLAGLCAHIGQPVLISGSEADGLCGLRLSAGARVVSGTLEGGGHAFLDREIADARLILAKIGVLLAHLDHLMGEMAD